MAKGWAAQSINFLIGIARRRHHSEARNSPWTMYFNGVRRHQKANGRSLPCAIWRRAVSPPTGGADPRWFLGHRAPCASGRVHAAGGRSRPPGRTEMRPSSRARLPVILPAAAVGSRSSASCALPQHGRMNPEFGRDLHLRSATALQQGHRLALELPSRLRHRTPSSPAWSVSEVSAEPGEDQTSSRSGTATGKPCRPGSETGGLPEGVYRGVHDRGVPGDATDGGA